MKYVQKYELPKPSRLLFDNLITVNVIECQNVFSRRLWGRDYDLFKVNEPFMFTPLDAVEMNSMFQVTFE